MMPTHKRIQALCYNFLEKKETACHKNNKIYIWGRKGRKIDQIPKANSLEFGKGLTQPHSTNWLVR